MASGMANTDDGTCWETVLRYFETPTPAQYSFEFDARIEDEGQPFEENLLVDEYLFKQQPHCIPRQAVHSKNQAFVEWKQAIEAKSDCKHINPAKFLKLTEIEMVQSLRQWKQLSQEGPVHPVTIKEADVYRLHPADLIKGACTHYFYSVTKYSCLKRPTRLRITENGCRWKQQGRIFPIRESGQTVAYKTYLSYVALKNGNKPKKLSVPSGASMDAATSNDMVCKRRDRKWSLWTMEEIGLADDIQSERVVLRRGGRPRPFPVICRIVCKRDGQTSAPLQAKMKCKKPLFRTREDSGTVVEQKPREITTSAPAAAPASSVSMPNQISWLPNSTNVQISCLPGSSSGSMMTAQDILEDEIIRALIYDLPYGKVVKYWLPDNFPLGRGTNYRP